MLFLDLILLGLGVLDRFIDGENGAGSLKKIRKNLNISYFNSSNEGILTY